MGKFTINVFKVLFKYTFPPPKSIVYLNFHVNYFFTVTLLGLIYLSLRYIIQTREC